MEQNNTTALTLFQEAHDVGHWKAPLQVWLHTRLGPTGSTRAEMTTIRVFG